MNGFELNREPRERRGGTRRSLRRIPFAALVVAALLPIAPAALAAPTPSVVDTSSAGLGASKWTYGDIHDASPKYEGGYVSLNNPTGTGYNNPHGGYSTTGTKCKACHAVHRAESSYTLLRAESQADACSYCHVDSAYSKKSVYDDNPQGTNTTVGHAMGKSGGIPLSTTQMSIVTTELALTDSWGNVTTDTITIRSMETTRNGIFRLRREHAHRAPGSGRDGYTRTGPTSLNCMSCHQVHGAIAEMWRPMAFPANDRRLEAGYKLLRRSPSGSIEGPDDVPYPNGIPEFKVSYSKGMRELKEYTKYTTTGLVDASNTVAAPETTLTAGVFGTGATIWDSPDWRNTQRWSTTPSVEPTPGTDVRGVNQFALSVWCADCHNAAIGSLETTGPVELGLNAHGAARTHKVPFVGAGNGPAQCFTCHRAGLSAEPTKTPVYGSKPECERCHYGTGSYATDPERADDAVGDFPHSAQPSSAYLLGSWSVEGGNVVTATVTVDNAQEKVCVRCHVPSGDTHDHQASVDASATWTRSFDSTYSAEPTTTMSFENVACSSCHVMDAKREHARPTSGGDKCGVCHSAGDASAVWTTRSCSADGCHETRHTDMDASHATDGTPTCIGCHQKWAGMDAAEVHMDAWKSWTLDGDPAKHPYVGTGAMPEYGCAVCHTDNALATTTFCDDCHEPHQ